MITVQREFRARFRKDTPCRNKITRWYRLFVETGCFCKGESPGRPRVSDDNIERVRDAFMRSPRKSVTRASRELDTPKWCTLCPCKVRNKFLFNFRNRIILLCILYIYIYIYTGCPRRNVPDFGRVFLMLKYTDITQNTYVQSGTVTEIMAREV